MLSLDGSLDTGDENDASLARVGAQRRIAEIVIVKRQRQRVKSKLGCSIDQLVGVVGNHVHRVLRTVEVQVYFQHVTVSFAIWANEEQSPFRTLPVKLAEFGKFDAKMLIFWLQS